MKKELDEQLVKDFPKIFKNRYGDMQETAMCWGFMCDDGWYWLIRELCTLLQWDVDRNNGPQIVASQVKEKFGALRFYTNGETERQSGMIDLAQSMSANICELCGSTRYVEQNKKGWVKTLCTWCRESESKQENGKAQESKT